MPQSPASAVPPLFVDTASSGDAPSTKIARVAAEVPVIDIGPLVTGQGDAGAVGRRVDAACREVGFFYVVGHGLDPALSARLDELSRVFFDLPDEEKAEIAMARGGRAWRGWFPVGGGLTFGLPGLYEVVYFRSELGRDIPWCRHGAQLGGP